MVAEVPPRIQDSKKRRYSPCLRLQIRKVGGGTQTGSAQNIAAARDALILEVHGALGNNTSTEGSDAIVHSECG